MSIILDLEYNAVVNMNREIEDPQVQHWMERDHKIKMKIGRRIIESMGEDISEGEWYPNWEGATCLPKSSRYEIPEVFLNLLKIPEQAGNRRRKNAIIEFIGFPEFGKSTISKEVLRLMDGRISFLEEFVSSAWNPKDHPGIKLGQVATVLEDMGVESREKFYNGAGLVFSLDALRQYYVPPISDKDSFRHLLVARGVNDLLIGFRRPWINYSDREIEGYLRIIFGMIEEVDAVILGGISYETAVERRKAAGKLENSYVVNPQKWPISNEGYSWWLKRAYPIMKEAYGTGLLVLNAEDKFDTNVARSLIFLGQVMNQCEGI